MGEMIKEELTRHEVTPDPNPWLEDKIQIGRVKLYSDRDIVTELGKLYGTSATSMYLTLLLTSCDTFNAGFFEEYYGTMEESLQGFSYAEEYGRSLRDFLYLFRFGIVLSVVYTLV